MALYTSSVNHRLPFLSKSMPQTIEPKIPFVFQLEILIKSTKLAAGLLFDPKR
jgi:hypothetical protein